MSPERQQAALDMLRSMPESKATARQLAGAAGWPSSKASRDLGIMHFAGLLDRKNIDPRGCEYLYWEKVKKIVAPAIWSGSVRLAESASRDKEAV